MIAISGRKQNEVWWHPLPQVCFLRHMWRSAGCGGDFGFTWSPCRFWAELQCSLTSLAAVWRVVCREEQQKIQLGDYCSKQVKVWGCPDEGESCCSGRRGWIPNMSWRQSHWDSLNTNYWCEKKVKVAWVFEMIEFSSTKIKEAVSRTEGRIAEFEMAVRFTKWRCSMGSGACYFWLWPQELGNWGVLGIKFESVMQGNKQYAR